MGDQDYNVVCAQVSIADTQKLVNEMNAWDILSLPSEVKLSNYSLRSAWLNVEARCCIYEVYPDDFLETTKETEKSQLDYCVLLLDSDATCLVNLSEMLRKYGYRVVATTRADVLLFIIKYEKIDLVLAERGLIEMNKCELLRKIRSICEIPVVVAGANVKNVVISDCLCKGAEFYLTKPLTNHHFEILWQIIFRRQQNFLSQIDTNPPQKKYSITHTQSLGDENKQNNKNNEVEKEDLDEYKGENFELGDQKKQELTCPDDQLRQGNKRKERVDTDTGEHTKKNYCSDLGDQKKPKLNCAEDLQNETLGAIPNREESNNERKETTEKPELVCMEAELEKWSTEPVTDIASYVLYEYQEQDFQPLKSVEESTGHQEIPLSPRESSNKNVDAQTNGELDEEVMQDGISLADLEFDLQEGHGSTSDLDNKSTQDLFDEIFNDLANELKP